MILKFSFIQLDLNEIALVDQINLKLNNNIIKLISLCSEFNLESNDTNFID